MLNWLKNSFSQSSDLIGIDIGTAAIKLVQLSTNKTGYQLTHYAIANLPSAAIVSKEVKNSAAVTQTLTQVLANLPKACKNVAIAIPDNLVISKIIQLDASLTEREIESCILLEADKHIPYPLEEINLDFQVQGISQQNPELVDILLIAARKNTVDTRIAAIHAADLAVKVVDVESYAIERAAHHLNYSSNHHIIAILDIGISMMSLTVLQNSQRTFVRNEILTVDESNSVESLIAKLQRMLQFFLSTHQQDEIQKLFLSGGVSLLPELTTHIAEILKINVLLANPFKSMQISSGIDKKELDQVASNLFLSCGLALHSFMT